MGSTIEKLGSKRTERGREGKKETGCMKSKLVWDGSTGRLV